MKILLTGSRAPVALDLSRRLHRDGHTVLHADSLQNGMGMMSNTATKTFVVPRPVDSPKRYVEALAEVIKTNAVDCLIPTCEEVFFIAAYRSLLPCRVLIDEFEKLAQIHNKWEFSKFAGNEFATVPQTALLNTSPPDEIAINCRDWVFKPVYSRFASRTLIGPSKKRLAQIQPTLNEPWIAQRRVHGVEYSTYSIVKDGKLLAHSTYKSLYKAGVGSGICFQPKRIPVIEHFVRVFAKKLNYTGQIGFDFICDQQEHYWVLEGNPRATSGAQLFDHNDPLSDALLRNNNDVLRPSNERPAMIEFAMPVWGLWDAIINKKLQFPADLIRSRWMTMTVHDPWPTLGLLKSLWEIARIARRENRTLQQASTFDIEWNGAAM